MEKGKDENNAILSGKLTDFMCTLCKKDGKNREAEKFCLDCCDGYCGTCIKVHENDPSMHAHEIINEEKLQSGSSQTLSSSPQQSSEIVPAPLTIKCDKHRQSLIDKYCKTHDEVGCTTCMETDHRSCKEIFFIHEFLQHNADASTVEPDRKMLDSAVKQLSGHLDKFQDHQRQLLQRKARTLENVRRYAKEINDRVDALEKISEDEVESIYKDQFNEMEKTLKMIHISKTKAVSALERITSTSKTPTGKNSLQDFVNAKKGRQAAEKAIMYAKVTGAHINGTDVNFNANRRLSDMLQIMQSLGQTSKRTITTYGIGKNADVLEKMKALELTSKRKITISGADLHKITFPSNADGKQLSAPDNAMQKDGLLQATGRKKYRVNISSDQATCDIVSACTLEDGTIILSDFNNNKLKRVESSQFTVTDYCDLSATPWQVCPTSKQEVAVCLMRKQAVQFVSTGRKMAETKKIKTDLDCYGLAYAEGNLYISDWYSSVHVYSVSGSKLHEFGRDQSGVELFSSIISLAVNKTGSKIYVFDRNTGLVVLDKNGQIVGLLNDAQFNRGCGCYLNETKKLLLCGCDSFNMLQFGPKGELIQEVVKTDNNDKSTSHSYQSVCITKNMSKMIVTLEVDDDIVVYDIVKNKA